MRHAEVATGAFTVGGGKLGHVRESLDMQCRIGRLGLRTRVLNRDAAEHYPTFYHWYSLPLLSLFYLAWVSRVSCQGS